MTAPTLVSSTATAFTAATKTLTLSSISVQSGDVLELFATAENNDDVPFGTPSGGASSWTLRQSSTTASNASSYLWTGPVASSGTVSISVTKNAANDKWGFVVRVWRGSGGIGASAKAVAASTATVSITTTAADSAVGVGAGDWNGNSGATNWGSGGTEDVVFVSSGNFAVHAGHYADIATAGAHTVGTSTPTGEKATVLAVEILGASGSQSFSYTMAGGVVLAGNAGELRLASPAGSGGLSFSSSAPQARVTVRIPTGGILFAGSPAQSRVTPRSVSGGLVLSGSANEARHWHPSASGGLVLAGSASESSTAHSFSYTGSGGLILSGNALSSYHVAKLTASMAGGITLSGVASVSYFNAGAAPIGDAWYPSDASIGGVHLYRVALNS